MSRICKVCKIWNQNFKSTPTRTNLPIRTYQNKPNLLNQIHQTKLLKPNLPDQTNQTMLTKPNLPNQTNQSKPKLLIKAVNALVRSAFGNVLWIVLWIPTIYKAQEKGWVNFLSNPVHSSVHWVIWDRPIFWQICWHTWKLACSAKIKIMTKTILVMKLKTQG